MYTDVYRLLRKYLAPSNQGCSGDRFQPAFALDRATPCMVFLPMNTIESLKARSSGSTIHPLAGSPQIWRSV
jgi:hypothetical protein